MECVELASEDDFKALNDLSVMLENGPLKSIENMAHKQETGVY